MRDIKFRAWKKYTQKYLEADELLINLSSSNLQNLAGGKFRPIDVVVEQYTGLKDKNGVDVYEGDIVKVVSQYWGQLGNTYEVKFESGSFLVPTTTLSDIKGSVVVIGNIHDNVDLLEEQS